MNQQWVFFYIFIPLFLLILLYLGIIALIVKELRKNNIDVWECMGKPAFLNQSIQNNFILSKFIYFREYRKVNNKKVHMLGNTALIMNIPIIFLFILFIVETGGKGLHFTL